MGVEVVRDVAHLAVDPVAVEDGLGDPCQLRHHVVPLGLARPGAVPVDIDQLTMHFKARVRDVVVIPFDDHLAEGAEISMDLLNRKTRQAFLDLTASVAEGFNRNRRVPRLR